MNDILAVLLGFGIRFGIPLLLTILAVVVLRRVDEKWRREAQSRRAQLVAAGVIQRNTGCWDEKNCSEDARARCKAYACQDMPCWQVFRSKDGELQDRCLDCYMFKESPLPVAT